MKTFFGSIFIESVKLASEGILHPIRLEYYKMITENELKKIYGIVIVKTEYKDEQTYIEEKVIEYLTDDEKIIHNVLDLFKRNEVTPIVASDILEDMQFYENV